MVIKIVLSLVNALTTKPDQSLEIPFLSLCFGLKNYAFIVTVNQDVYTIMSDKKQNKYITQDKWLAEVVEMTAVQATPSVSR